MKKLYIFVVFAICSVFVAVAQDHTSQIWDFEGWTQLPNSNPNFRSAGGAVLALEGTTPAGNTSAQWLKIETSGGNQGLVFEQITPAFDITNHNTVTVLVYATEATVFVLEMMNSSSANKIVLESTLPTDSANKWTTLSYDIPPTIANDLTKHVFKTHSNEAAKTYYIDDISFIWVEKNKPTAINISNTVKTILSNKTVKINYTVTPEGADNAVNFTSSNELVATVDASTGIVTPVATGTTKITLTSKADNSVTNTIDLTFVGPDVTNSYTRYNFESHPYNPPVHAKYEYDVVANPLVNTDNETDKVLMITITGGAWAWTDLTEGWDLSVDNVTECRFKLLSTVDIAQFSVEFGIYDVGKNKPASLTANTWTDVVIPLNNFAGTAKGLYIFPNDKFIEGVLYFDELMFIAGNVASYQQVWGVTVDDITADISDGPVVLTPTVQPFNASNDSILWSYANPSAVDSAIALIDSSGTVTPKLAGVIDIIATTFDGRYTDTVTVTVTGIGSSIAEDKTKNGLVYPNPADEYIQISEISNAVSMKLYNLLGVAVMNVDVLENQIDISSLKEGIYILEITTKQNKQLFSRIVVK